MFSISGGGGTGKRYSNRRKKYDKILKLPINILPIVASSSANEKR
jgi:hypothetical protein